MYCVIIYSKVPIPIGSLLFVKLGGAVYSNNTEASDG